MAEFILPPDEGADQLKAAAPLTGTGFVMPQDPAPATLVNARDAASGNPDEYAKAKKIAERLALPIPVVQNDLTSYDTEQKVQDAQARMARDPFYAQQMRDPNFAKLSSGDEGILGAVKDVVTFPWKATQAAAGGLYQLSSGIYGVGAAAAELGSTFVTKPLTGTVLPEDVFGKIGAKLRAASASTREYGKRVTDLPSDAGLVRTAIASGFESLGQNLPLMVAALYTGNVALALSIMSASSGGQSYTKAREAGLSVAKATQYGLVDAGFEYLTEMFPLTKLLGDMKAGAPFVKAFMRNQVSEQLGEQAATVLQDFNEWVTLHPEKPFSAYLEARPVAALQTAIATAIGSGGQVALLHVAAKAADMQVESANRDAAALQALLEHSEKSLLAKRDTPTFTQFVNDAAARGPVDSVYIDAVTFAQAAQQAGVDVKATMPETAAALDEAIKTTSDVRIPLGEFAANSTLFQPEIVKHLKTDPNGATQAQTADAEWVKETQAATEKALAQHEFTSAIKQSGDAVKQELKAQLTAANRFTPEVNDAYAGFMAAFYTTQAARLGITPEQMYVKYPLRIQAQNFEGVNVLTQMPVEPMLNVGLNVSKKPVRALREGDTGILAANQILTSAKSFSTSDADERGGRKGTTEGPLDVWRTEDGRYLLVDGQHRFARGVAAGKKNFDVRVVGEGYSDVWATPAQGAEYVHPGVQLTATDVVAALKTIGVDVVEQSVQQSTTEPTLVATLSRPLTPTEAHDLSVALKQEAIAQHANNTGALYGPNAAAWGDYNPDFFLLHNGQPATSVLQQSAMRVKNMTPTIRRLLKNLTPYERRQVTDSAAAAIVAQLEDVPVTDELAAIAWAGRAKRGWYAESARAIAEVFGWDAPHFAALLAALSPQTDVETDLRHALKVWRAWDAAGRPRDRAAIIEILAKNVDGTGTEKSVLDAWINNSVHALQDIDSLTARPLSGPKVNSFYLNLLGNVNEVTLDAWMANYALVDQTIFKGGLTKKQVANPEKVRNRNPGKGSGYLAYASRVREAAARLTKLTGETWTPAEVQETIWSWAKTLYEYANREGETRTAHQIVLDDALTNELLTSTPDFANLFHDPKYASILQDAGYGQQLEELAASRRGDERDAGQDDEPGVAGEATPFDRATQKRHEARAAKRLDKLAEAGGKKAMFQQGAAPSLPEHGARVPGSVSVVGVHYSTEQRAFLSSGAYGTGAKGAERAGAEASGDPRLMQRIHFYVNQGAGTRPEPGVGVVAHAVRLNGLYDASADRLGLFKGHAPAEAESAVLDNGFTGYYSRNFGDRGAVVLLGPQTVPVEPVDPASIREVPPPADPTPERRLAEALVAVPGLPGGQMSGPDWINTIWKAAPQIASQIPESALATLEAHTDLMYRDEVARTFYQLAYHGSQDFGLRGNDKVHASPYRPFWVTPSKALAQKYQRGGTLSAFDFNVKKPADLRDARLTQKLLTIYNNDPAILEEYGVWSLDTDGNIQDSAYILANSTEAMDYLVSQGYDALLVEEHPGVLSYGLFSPEQAGKAFSILEQGEAKPRGQISFGSDIQATPSVLTLLANADLSTFLHESGHFYLEVLRDMAAQPDAPPEVVADFAKTLAWFGVKDTAAWDAMTLEEKRPFHEQFARGFETYLFEGKAPSETLQPLFQRFRAWMVNVYRQLKALDVSLTDEVRGVFDRLVASNEEILQAETARTFAPLYETKPEGMTDAEWGDYHTLGGEATQEAVDQLQTRSLRDMQYASNAKTAALKRLQQRAAALRKGVRAEVTAQVSAEPIYQAIRFLKTGVYEGESAGTYTKHRLDIEALNALYPEDMPDRPPLLNLANMRGYDGIAPDVAARMFGYGSGDVFVREVLGAEPMQQKIDGITDQQMLERHGDLADPASMEKAANAAVHNEVRAKFIATELRALEKAAGNRPTLMAMAREFAATLIARKKIRTLRPTIYSAAAAKAAKNADTAFRKDDVATAAGEKRNQLVNTYAARFASDALDEVEKSVAYLKRVGESKAIDPEYRTQINALLERFDLRKISGPEAARRQSLVQWIEAQREKGFEPAIDPALENEALRQPHQEMTLEEFRGLVDSIKNIEHLGRLKHKLLVLQDKRELALIVESVRQSIEANAKRTIPHRTEGEMSARKQILAFHTKLSSFMRQLDGWQDNGIMQRLFVHSSNAAGAREAGMHEQATMQLIALFEPLLQNETTAQKAGRAVVPFGAYKGYLSEKLFIPEINESLSREGRIMVALNTGNEGNLQRLMDGDHWTDKQVQAVVDTLTKQEMDFVQSVWDFLGAYRPSVAEQQKRLTGVEPTWIEPRRVITKWGEYAGGYLPAKYNGAMSSRSLSDEAAANLTDALRATRGSAAARAGFTKERAAKVINRPLRKDFGVITQHVTEVTHRLAWQEWLVDVNRILRASAVDGAIRDHYGPEMLEAIREHIEAIAAGNVGPQNALERGVNYLRTGATIAGLGWRLTTSLLQPFGLTQSWSRIGTKWIGKGIAEFLGDAAHMENSFAKISAKSEMMRLRAKTMQREISEIQDTVTGEGGAIKASFFYLIQKAQLIADIPTWLGQYHKALETSGIEDPAALEANAIAQADQAVLDAQGSGQVKDLPAVLRGSPYLKLWTNFASFFIGTTFQLTREAVGRTKFNSPASVLMLAADFVLLYSLPAALGTLMKYALSSDDDEDKLLRNLISDQLSYMLGTMIGLRELGSVGRGLAGLPGDYGGPAGGRVLGEITKLGKQIHQGEADEAFFKALNNAAGIIFHYPAGQIGATADGIATLADGKTTNPGVLAVGSNK